MGALLSRFHECCKNRWHLPTEASADNPQIFKNKDTQLAWEAFQAAYSFATSKENAPAIVAIVERADQAERMLIERTLSDVKASHRAFVLETALKEARNIFVRVVGWSENCDAVRIIDFVLAKGQHIGGKGGQP